MTKRIASALATVFALSLSVPAFAEETVGATSSAGFTTTSSAASSVVNARLKPVDRGMNKSARPEKMKDGTCMAAAIEKRETRIMTAVDTFASSVKTGITMRKDSLKAAYGLTDAAQRNTAIRAAWTAFQGTWQKARTALRASQKSAWQTFKDERKACGDTSNAESTSENIDVKI